VKRVEGDAEGQDERRYLHGPGADEGQGGARIAREEGGVLVEHEEAQVERDCYREHGPGAGPAADAVEPEPEPEVGRDRREHDHDEAGLAPAEEDETQAEETEIAQPASGDEVPGEDYGQEEEKEDRRAEDHMTSLEGRPARCQFSWSRLRSGSRAKRSVVPAAQRVTHRVAPSVSRRTAPSLSVR